MSHSNKRWHLFIDRPVQSALLARVVLYWAVSLLTQVLMVVFFAVISSSPDDFYLRAQQLWSHLQLAIIASALILPLILLDVLRLSHRWVGPIFRVRSALRSLSRGERVPPIRLRQGDFWQELAGDFNVVADQLRRQQASASTELTDENLATVADD